MIAYSIDKSAKKKKKKTSKQSLLILVLKAKNLMFWLFGETVTVFKKLACWHHSSSNIWTLEGKLKNYNPSFKTEIFESLNWVQYLNHTFYLLNYLIFLQEYHLEEVSKH